MPPKVSANNQVSDQKCWVQRRSNSSSCLWASVHSTFLQRIIMSKNTSEKRALPIPRGSPFPAHFFTLLWPCHTQVCWLCSLVSLVFAYSAPFGWNTQLCFPYLAYSYSSLTLGSPQSLSWDTFPNPCTSACLSGFSQSTSSSFYST